MAILAANHVWSGESWEDDEEGPRGYQALYRVISNNPTESPLAVRAAVPSLRSAYPSDPAAYLVKRSATRSSESRLVWEVTLTYEFDPEDPEEPEESPLDEPPKFRWTAGQYTKPVIKDRDNEAIVNSAGDYFDPPPEIEDVRWTVNIQKNVASVPAAVLTYAGRVNESSFTVDGVSVLAEKARIVSLDIGELQEKNEINYRVFTCAIEFREEGWDLELLDQGYRIKDGTDLKDILIADENGDEQRPSSPVLLDGLGAELTDPSPETAVFLMFPVHKLLDFSVLPGIT